MSQIIHIFLAILIYISGIGVSVHEHYCQDELKNIAFWQSAESCHAGDNICPATGKVCMMHAKTSQKKDCCDDRVSLEQADWDFVPDSQHKAIQLDFNATPPVIRKTASITIFEFLRSPQKYRPPPLITTPRRILFSSFLC